MKTITLLKVITSIMMLFSITVTTAQNFQYTKKKYSYKKVNNGKLKDNTPTNTAVYHFTDAELIKLAGYIKKLEKQNTLTGELISIQELTPAENTVSTKNTTNDYTNEEIIKLADYIRFLETTDLTHVVAAIK